MHHLRALWFIPRLLNFWNSSPKLRQWTWLSATVLFVLLLATIRSPNSFPSNEILTVRERATITEVGEYLKDHHAISSPFLFTIFIKMFNPHNGVLSGTYYFTEPKNLITVAYRISKGKFGLTPIIFTVPEGSNISQIADMGANTFPDFDKEKFIQLAKDKEGYLFPDTYYFLPTVAPREIVETMEKNFNGKIASLEKEMREYGRPLSDVIKMASYLEEEARLTQTRRMVAGILWKRLDEGMLLQIDSSFQYVNGKNTFQLTLEDLKIDSPYNTYEYKGLTPTPISSPGLDAILAAVTPIESKYYYFLSDKNGVMRYAVTHDEHVANKNRYLR